MPKLTRPPSHHQYQPHLPVSLAQTTMSYYPTRQPVPNFYDPLPSSTAASMAMPPYDAYAVNTGPPLQIPSTSASMGGPVGQPLPAQHRASSGAWNQEDDRALLALRAMGKNWNQIQREAFPGKTGNACRKRHERLMERRGQNDFDNRKLERLSKEYMSMRKEIWQPLAQRCGEKWNVVESQCMSNGLKNIQSHARACARRERLESGQPLTGYDDDSGVSGIGLTPIDDMADQSYSSPEASGSAGAHSTPGGSSNGGSSHHTSFATMHHSQGGYANYQTYQPQHGYSNSVSSTGTAYGQPQGQGSQGASPYMGGSRLPSVGEMGINSLINRGPGQQ
ncbi:hypothetical protein QBC47DRAFT_304928 [Echria macrotheca]|uniref:Myb-like domain-containing protein n=1 Tax=Echria macrotheca TaxID=438768 RepID=A0AAJ0B788_9PEZI|nr:hypothetical protein QBC47DRAFT_304928 [Echria macrotheca]